jgi:hypothetical protein
VNKGDGLIPPAGEFRIKFESAIALCTKGVLFVFFFKEFYLCVKTVGTFQVGQHFLDMAPLFA